MPRTVLFADMTGLRIKEKLGEYQITSEDLQNLAPYLSWLPPKMRDVFVLRRFANLPQTQIARLLQITQPNVIACLRRAEIFLPRIIERQEKWLPVLVRFLEEHAARYNPTAIRALVAGFFSGNINSGAKNAGITTGAYAHVLVDALIVRVEEDGLDEAAEMIRAVKRDTFRRVEQHGGGRRR